MTTIADCLYADHIGATHTKQSQLSSATEKDIAEAIALNRSAAQFFVFFTLGMPQISTAAPITQLIHTRPNTR